ncbi:MAG TPA: copper homeostasis protein CutC [Fimbriiglobus sp.]|nr:copper homeostasis protein CutC [Fimbriiglobus sp.]
MPTPRRVLIEVAAESVEDAVAAEEGGADRIELCAALDLGGLTPSLGLYQEVRAATRLPVFVMIRPRPGDFVYTPYELRTMARDLDAFRLHQPDGFVFGALVADGRIDVASVGHLAARAGGLPCVFHRAFDRVTLAGEALDQLIAAGFARVLTSGREATALAGAGEIAKLVKRAAGRIEVLPCGRVRAKDVSEVIRLTGCNQVHGSFARPLQLPDERGYRGYAERVGTSRDEVAATRSALDTL